ncbi:GHMP kinase [Candidatus Woesearchaeota archaeon]|nr:GHMP kinase [Candidatus Woesearchaeota archaeon]
MTIIRSRSPHRIEFCGGGTDVPEYYKKNGGFVINAAINKYSYVSLHPYDEGIKITLENKNTVEFPNLKSIKFEGDFDLVKAIIKKLQINNKEIFLRNDILPSSGLGTNAAIATAVIGVIYKLREQTLDKKEIAEAAYEIASKELGIYGGKQNQYSSAFGGINSIEFKKDGEVIVTPLKISKNTLRELEKHLVLVYVGKRINPNEILKKQEKESLQNNKLEDLDKLKYIAMEMKDVLESGDTIKFGKLMDKAWNIKKVFNPNISTQYIEHIYEIAKKNGAIGGMINGAGGGGHILFYAEPNKEPLLVRKLQENGARVLDFSFDLEGLDVWDTTK